MTGAIGCDDLRADTIGTVSKLMAHFAAPAGLLVAAERQRGGLPPAL